MDTNQMRQISVIEPIGAAIEKTKQILFQPFDITKWFAIGFCAFLATLGNGGWPNAGGGGGQRGGHPQDFQHQINTIKDSVLDNLPIIISVAAVVLLLILVISVVLMWVKSRGQFMFLHCVARNVAEVKNPWKQYAQQANSLFLFKLALWAAGFVGAMLFIIPLVMIGTCFVRVGIELFPLTNILWVFLLIFGIIVVAVAIWTVKLLTNEFVVPIMYLRGCFVKDAWRECWQLLMSNKGPFTLYLLFLLVIGLAIGMIVLLAVLVTCCCAACFLMIPYIGTVVMLPILVWRRAYSLLYLSQYGPEFDVFVPEPTPIVVPTASIPPIGPEHNP
ncbi:MAG: DUF7544 domain-containing protein [Planctomycetota bacterium]|jgi:hypothetical protein